MNRIISSMRFAGDDERLLRLAVDSCTRCHNLSLRAAMTHCLPERGERIHEERCTLLLNCSDVCQMAANFILTGSPFTANICRMAAEICEACAESCGEVAGMLDCVDACRGCARLCRQIAVQPDPEAVARSHTEREIAGARQTGG